jgi:signal transduction histidine kinase
MALWSDFAARIRLSPSLALTSAVVLILIGVLMTLYQEQLYRDQASRQVTVQAEILAASVTAALVFDDPGTAQSYVDALAVNPEMEAAAVYNSAGQRLAGFDRPGAAPLPAAVQPGRAFFRGDRLLVVRPVMQGTTRLGAVYLRAITDSLQRRLARYGAVMLLAIMAALLLAVLGTSQLALTRANRELEQRAHDLAETNRKLQIEMNERALAEEALRQSQKMEAIGQLSGGIAHDFNNLLTIIKGNLQLMHRRIAQGRTDVQRYLDSATEGLNRAASLTQRILAFSRRQPLSPQRVNLSKLVEGIADLLRHSVGDRVGIDTRLTADWWTLCDANQMENVLLNLAINARDAMPDGGRLTIATSNMHVEKPLADFEDLAPGDYIRLTVQDTGVGMPEDVRQKAIDPFFTTKPQGQGTGLGLSMTFGYIRQSNGYLKIDSTVGVGTTITILMPREAANVVATETPVAAQ